MIPFREKPNHCFVACLASCLADDGDIKLQELLVRFFSEKLRYRQSNKEEYHLVITVRHVQHIVTIDRAAEAVIPAEFEREEMTPPPLKI